MKYILQATIEMCYTDNSTTYHDVKLLEVLQSVLWICKVLKVPSNVTNILVSQDVHTVYTYILYHGDTAYSITM